MKGLKQNPTLKDFQNYIEEMVKQCGFEKETLSKIFMLLTEKCDEFAKTIRRT